MSELKQVLMERDGMSELETEEAIEDAKEVLNEYIEEGDLDGAYNVCQEMFGLEPDYIMELIG